MELRVLGSTGILVSPICLGTVKLGRNQQVKYPDSFRIPDDKQVANLLAIAKANGINMLDTAPAYGNSESRLGQMIKHHRKDWVVLTKAGESFVNGQSVFDFSATAIRHSVEQSLRHLNTDYLDVVLIHSDGNDLDILQQTDAFEALDKLKQEGWIRSHGMSSKTREGGLQVVNDMDVVMATCNMAYDDELDVLLAAKEQGKGVIIKKALQSGHATEEDGVYKAMQYIYSQPGVSSISIGTINPQHLVENTQCAEQVLNEISL